MDSSAYFSTLSELDLLDMDSSVQDVQKHMSKTGHTLVPVVDSHNKVFGVVSAIDVIDFLAGEGNARTTKAWEICSHKLLRTDSNTDPLDIAAIFLKNKVHHILLTEGEEVVAIVSSMDLCRFLLQRFGHT